MKGLNYIPTRFSVEVIPLDVFAANMDIQKQQILTYASAPKPVNRDAYIFTLQHFLNLKYTGSSKAYKIGGGHGVTYFFNSLTFCSN